MVLGGVEMTVFWLYVFVPIAILVIAALLESEK